jgi:O-6-methylguanine DNA methyltransferase
MFRGILTNLGTIRYAFIRTELGEISAARTADGICALQLPSEGTRSAFLDRLENRYPGGRLQQDTGRFSRLAEQLHEYLLGNRRTFELKLAPGGTRFQNKVWDRLAQVPFGYTCTVDDLGQRLGRRFGSGDAVVRAVRANPLAILIPCHRVVDKHQNGDSRLREELERRLRMLESHGLFDFAGEHRRVPSAWRL